MSMFLTSGHIRAGVDSMRRSKIRSFWTMLGIIIGVTSVISIVAIGEGIKTQIGGEIHHYGSNLITVRTAELTTGSGSSNTNYDALSGFSVSSPLSSQDIVTVNKTKGVTESAPLTLVSGAVKGDYGTDKTGFVLGTSNQLPSLLNQSLQYGNFFGASDADNNVAVLGENAALALFNEDVPLGRSLIFRGQKFIVDGIFNQFTTTPLSQQADFNNAVFIPNDVGESLTKQTAPTYEILARSGTAQQTKAVANSIRSNLNAAHGGQSGFQVLTGNQDLDVNNGILDLLTKLIAGVAAISLLVGSIGIMNVMLVSVAERVREIGIRKAVGATNRQILSQFMVESSLISFLGGLIGIGLSYLIELGIRLSTNLEPTISWQIVALAAGVSLLLGIVFGTFPAVKAARKDPIEALRAE
jgi:putative ABC transport system permease protein